MPLSLEFVWKKTIIDSMPTFQIKYAWASFGALAIHQTKQEVEGVVGVDEQ